MATLMSRTESDFFEENGYTLHEVPHAGFCGGYRVIQWEPTWEEFTPSEEALATWHRRKSAFQQGKKRARGVEGGGGASSSSDHAIDLDAIEDDAVSPTFKELQAEAQVQARTQQQSPPQHLQSITVAHTGDASRQVYGAVCSVFKPHLVFAIAGDIRDSLPLQGLFAGHEGCASAIKQRRSFLWLSVMSDQMDSFMCGQSTEGTVDAYPGEAEASIHPSRRGTTKAMAFEGEAVLSGTGGDCGLGVLSTLTLALQIRGPSSALSEQCRRPSTPAIPYKVEVPLRGEVSFRIEVTQAKQPYLTNPSSARPNTPRCKVLVRLLDVVGQHSLLARAHVAALDVCTRADHAQHQ